MISRYRRLAAMKRGKVEQWPEWFDPQEERPSQEQTVITRDEWLRALRVVRELPDDLKNIVLACDLHGDDPQTFGATIGISGNAARQRLFRARAKVRERLL